MHPPPRSWAEIDLSALRENLAWIRHRVGSGVQIMTVVKADAYGHGLKQIAALLMQSGTDVFGVANLTEARSIRAVGRGWPILMLGACLPDEIESAIRDGVMPTVSTLAEAQRFSALASRLGQTVCVHVKVDTGMGRLGALPSEAVEILKQMVALPGLHLEGIYTHYAAVEDDPEFSRVQRAHFRKLLEDLASQGITAPVIHANNSGGLLHEPDSLYNLVRPGLLVYGVPPPGTRSPALPLSSEVRPALTWKCRVSLVKAIEPGTSLSYGRTFVANRPLRVATLSAGYGDGYMRSASNRAFVLIGGRRCPVVGRVTMDQMLVDVSVLGPVQVGDEATLIGAQGDAVITAGDLAAWCDTVPWEILTNISYRVPRLFRGAHAA